MILGKVKDKYIFKSVIGLTVFSLIGKILGFIRQVYIGYKFGPGELTDAFLVTNIIPTMILTDLSVAIQTNYIPIASNLGEDKDKKNVFTSNLINICLIIMLVGILIINLSPNFFIKIFATGLNDAAVNYAILMLRITSFSVIPIVLTHIFNAYMQIEGKFFSTASAPVIINIIIIMFIYISSLEKYYYLSLGIVFANLSVLLFLFFEAKKNGFCFSVNPFYLDSNIKKMVILTLPLIGENLASNLNIIVDRNVASMLSSGTLTSITYSNSIINIIFATLVIPISTVLFPRISKMANIDNVQLEKDFVYFNNILMFVLAPVIIFIGFYSKTIVEILFLRGSFTIESIRIIHETLTFYIIGVIGMGMKYFLVKFFYALKDTKTPTIISIISLAINIILNLILVNEFKHVGVAIATSLSYLFAYIALLIVFNLKYSFKVTYKSFLSLTMTSLAAVLSISICVLITDRFAYFYNIIKLLVNGLLFTLFYLIILIIFRYSTVMDILKKIKKLGE